MNIAIIPARGGSKRIPKKNIKLFHGKPMIAYSIEAAIQSGCFDKVIVSTDDQDIADIAIEYGADVPFFRPSNISDDYATTMDVMQHTINWCIEQQWNVEAVCCLYATAPFITSDYLIQGYEKLIKNKADFVFSAATFSFPIQRAIKLTEKGEVSMFSPEYEQTRSQDLEEAYHDAGQFYWGKADSFLERKAMFAKHSTVILLPRSRVQDIDTTEDWSFAELLYSALESE